MPVISVRVDDAGGPVAREATTAGFGAGSSRLIILVHGYNNSKSQALESYGAFLENSGLGKAPVIGKACGFLWPGDRGGLLAMFGYPGEIETAVDSAAALHRFLMGRTAPGGWPLEVILICHSLGNRLGLELVERHLLAGAPENLSYRAGCFMAAAVPVFKVEQGGGLRAAAEAVERKAVLYSRNDAVLHYAFPLGQTLAGGGEGTFPRAVGRFGQPAAGLWTQAGDMGRYGYNHWNYWDRQESADMVAAFLSLAVGREIPQTVIAEREMTPQPAPLERGIAGRTLPVRAVG